ncbi:hypothetical protein DL98DRAFT_114373 [Cadophora sp. DSE1049]|nr:hypothetical protein DL98DRAFT_114373 [Cadophora sp. DSE1049]
MFLPENMGWVVLISIYSLIHLSLPHPRPLKQESLSISPYTRTKISNALESSPMIQRVLVLIFGKVDKYPFYVWEEIRGVILEENDGGVI